ncbi:flagellar basal body-associated FliL family protein [Paenibacillus sp. N3/727]|uniref:flagellar basal body-associated FliL family protein n=1 Tax=Paenibacillus sp. N3/727 TaxID=2925845 RepID=UPI001F539553|nr:flagellar basal body-associated FliL family protein [Paenibacillus sp. N3/727]UNK16701.1 flagellar basal body-associated FliL family protein [Paenibacillus sp. N3/727]
MKKMLPWLVTIMLSITLIVLAVFLLSDKMLGKDESGAIAAPAPTPVLSADEIVEVTAEIIDVKTNLADPDYIAAMSFSFQLRNKKAKEDFDKIKEIKVKPIIIKTLADTKPENLKDSKATEQFTERLLDQINKTLPNGQLIHIEITNKLVAPL